MLPTVIPWSASGSVSSGWPQIALSLPGSWQRSDAATRSTGSSPRSTPARRMRSAVASLMRDSSHG